MVLISASAGLTGARLVHHSMRATSDNARRVTCAESLRHFGAVVRGRRRLPVHAAVTLSITSAAPPATAGTTR